MIVVDENTPRRLIRSLEEIVQSGQPMQCVHLRWIAHAAKLRQLRPDLLALLKKELPSDTQQVNFCEDGDVFLLDATIDSKAARIVVATVAGWLNIPANPDLVAFYEVDYHAPRIIAMLEQKIEKARIAELALEQRRAAEMAAQKRLAILNSTSHVDAEGIQRKREMRELPEVMVIEDDAFSRRLVETTIHKFYRVTAIGETTQAIQTYLHAAPDVLFLDINLPDVSGHDLLQKIISLDPHAYVVMLSGQADRENIMQAMQMGAKGFVAKPFTREKLFQYIEKFQSLNPSKVTG